MGSGRLNFLLGILLGGIAGAAAMLLYAPQSGGETREQIKKKGREARDRASDMAGSVKESAGKVADKSREFVDTKQSQIRQAVEAGREAAAKKRAELQSEKKEGEPKASM